MLRIKKKKKKIHIEAPVPPATIFEGRPFKEVIKIIRVIKRGPNPVRLVSLEEEGETPGMHVCTGKGPREKTFSLMKAAVCKSQRERPQEKTNL